MLDQLLHEINAEDGYGVLLMTQMDGVPDTIQMMIATTEYDAASEGLRDKNRYLLRAVGVQEHRVSVGIFKSGAVFADEAHPLLYQYNSLPVGLFYRGPVEAPTALILSILQAHSSVFGSWRQAPAYLNKAKPLLEVFSGGGDLVGEMPQPLATALAPIFAERGLETKVITGEREGKNPPQKVLLLDDSYVVAMDFSVDQMGAK
jgi:hypothetical protein